MPDRLGVFPVEGGIQAAIPAPGAEQLLLCLFEGGREVARHELRPDGEVFHGRIAGPAAGTAYGLRASGPWAPGRGQRFNPAKLLLDPWARALQTPARLHPSAFDTGAHPDPADSGPHLAHAVLVEDLPPLPSQPLPAGPTVIYEMHVRGFTRLHPDIPEAQRGTFAGLAHPAAIAHLKRLGATHVELLPVAAWVDEPHLGPLGLTNYWGYNPVAWLAPDPRLAPGGMAEVRAAVAALRAAGIGVILDIVLNHTGEGGPLGPTLSLRGLGDGAWYRMAGDPAAYVDDTGCGNTVTFDRIWPLRLAMDAMRHWALQAGVDGFRLDLATTLGRREGGFDPFAPLLAAIQQDPVLRRCRIIAEPWDVAPDGYQLGRFPDGWPEWNDRFRDDVRRFWRGRDSGTLGPLASRLAGSADLFAGRVGKSVNFITAHDGFTLRDLVSFERRHNLGNGEQNRDGTGNNLSWNHGIEGPTPDQVIEAKRQGDIRALLATLLGARGTPMLSMGDEAGRSQHGNNNAYAQDSAVSWFDWDGLDQGLVDFTARLISARLQHPALHSLDALSGGPADESGMPDAIWLHPGGDVINPSDWEEARALVALLYAKDDRVLLACNGGDEALPLVLPRPRWNFAWGLVADSAQPDLRKLPEQPILAPRSVQLLAELPRARKAPGAAGPAALARLAAAAGIAPRWRDLSGVDHDVPEGTLRHVLSSLGLPAETAAQARESLERRQHRPMLPPHLPLQAGHPARLPLAPASPFRLELELTLEDGTRQDLAVAVEHGGITIPALPEGRHVLRVGDIVCQITAAPPACYMAPQLEHGRRFGVTAQTYALRHARDQGMGDFTAIAEFARAAAGHGAFWFGISPPHALPLLDRERASPYQPSDRRFLEPLLIDVSRLDGAPDFQALRVGETVDYPAVWQAKLGVLRRAWEHFDRNDPAFLAFRAEGGATLQRFAAFNAIATRAGHTDISRWPDGLRHGRDSGVAAFCAREADETGFHAWLQFLADRQLAEAAAQGIRLYRDLAIGMAFDGAERWSGDFPTLSGVSIGAPPDPLGPLGQVWGLPPPDPIASEAEGHAGFAALIRANMRHAGALRIDHVLGLKRLFLVPDGARASEGCYLDQPFEAWRGELALESHRAACTVVGEDLGTVPPGLREAMSGSQILSYRVLWFERDGPRFRAPDEYPALAATCVATHDLPPLAGWWEGTSIAEGEALGLLTAEEATEARIARAEDKALLLEALAAAGIEAPSGEEGAALSPAMAAAIHAYVAATPSAMLLIQAEDMAGERIALNLPGTDRERPNWRRRLPGGAEACFATPVAQEILARLSARM
ncbi:glycogen debranching protein GlgX [Roseococcus sp. YIM B11640]|uniref:glycogen debranching protein GlgX n=1 Tax=Roseococcus sp. YIM B11640 TaxID=3133973 RepID=UPI003C7EA844